MKIRIVALVTDFADGRDLERYGTCQRVRGDGGLSLRVRCLGSQKWIGTNGVKIYSPFNTTFGAPKS